jgi:uncharacterized protein YkwD
MAARNSRASAASVIVLLIAVALITAASAAAWQVHETASSTGPEEILTPGVVINVDAGPGLLNFKNVSTKPINTAYLQTKGTASTGNTIIPSPTPLPGSNVFSIPSPGTSPTTVTTPSQGASGRVPSPVPLTTNKSQKFPFTQSKPAVMKPVPTIKPVTAVLPLPTVLPPTPAQPVRSTIIVNDTTHQVEQRIFYYTNIERANVGKPALKWDEQLAIIGRDDCVDMAARGFFNHINPDGETPADRAIRHGYQVEKDFGTYVRVGVGENIAMLSNYPGSPDEVARFIVDAWMNSPGHRANIVDSEDQKFTVIGVGVAYDQGTDTWYAAQEFF